MTGMCKPCPTPGTSCKEKGVSLNNLPVNDYYWRSDATSSNLVRCENEEACVNSTCAEGHEGPTCGVCSDGLQFQRGGEV